MVTIIMIFPSWVTYQEAKVLLALSILYYSGNKVLIGKRYVVAKVRVA